MSSREAKSGSKEQKAEKSTGGDGKRGANASNATNGTTAASSKKSTRSSAKSRGRNDSAARRSRSGSAGGSSASTSSTAYRPDDATLLEWYGLMHLGRTLDEKAANYLKQAKGWSYHAPCSGHEGIQLALGKSFRPSQDFLFPYYRDLMTVLAAGLTPYEIILNGLSKDADVAGGGRHMSNHFAKPEIHIENVSSATGNHSLHAAGVAKAIKTYKRDAVAFYSGGESATAEGYFYEAVTNSAAGRFPVVFVVQNNMYGISVPYEEVAANVRSSDTFIGLKQLKIINVDGTDVLDSWRGMQEALAYIRSGEGPAMVHADCVRIGSHSNSDRQELYRDKEELEAARARDPLPKFRKLILDSQIATEEELQKIEKENKEKMFEAADRAEAMPDPSPDSYREFLFPEPYHAVENRAADGEEMTLLNALNTTMKQEFRRNPDLFMWGQDMATREKGGVFNVSKGMQQEFGHDRVHNAPIAEDYIVGSANGFSRLDDKIRVLIEGAEFADYYYPAMEQTVEMSHEYWRTRGQFSPNVTIRLASGGYITGGLYHSQTIEGLLLALPGIRIVYPSFADDAAGLLRTCVRSRGMTMFLEPKFLYNHAWAKTVVPNEFEVPFGVARTRREGSDLAIITYGNAVHLSLKAAERLAAEGVETEVLDLRSIRPLDEEAIYAAVRKTNRVLIAHEEHLTGGVGGELVALINTNAFDDLDAPVMRVASRDTPVGFSPILERAILLSAEDVYNAARSVIEF